jgi:hypothetical protein
MAEDRSHSRHLGAGRTAALRNRRGGVLNAEPIGHLGRAPDERDRRFARDSERRRPAHRGRARRSRSARLRTRVSGHRGGTTASAAFGTSRMPRRSAACAIPDARIRTSRRVRRGAPRPAPIGCLADGGVEHYRRRIIGHSLRAYRRRCGRSVNHVGPRLTSGRRWAFGRLDVSS